MATSTVDLRQVSVLAEIVVRAGNARQPDARHIMQKAYLAVDATYPDTIGISTLFRPDATLDELAREGSFPNAKISYSIVGRIIAELAARLASDNCATRHDLTLPWSAQRYDSRCERQCHPQWRRLRRWAGSLRWRRAHSAIARTG